MENKRLNNFEIEISWAVSLKIGMSSWINPALSVKILFNENFHKTQIE